MIYLFAVLCVAGLAIGQVLFKAGAMELSAGNGLFVLRTLTIFSCAALLYVATTVAWILILQKIELGKIYPIMALAFLFVPIGSYFIFNERFGAQYFFGIFMIMIGIILTCRS